MFNLLFKHRESVPTWNGYYPSISDATPAQKKFYKRWTKEMSRGNYLDIEGNLSYVFAYLYSLIQQFIKSKNLYYFLQCLEDIQKNYGTTYDKINFYTRYWMNDACLYLNEFDKAWSYIKGLKCDFSDIINFRAKCTDTSIDGQDLLCILGSDNGLTKFGRTYQGQISDLATIYLHDFHKEHGNNLIEYFCHKFDYRNLSEDDFSKLKEFYLNEDDFSLWRAFYKSDEKKKFPYQYKHYLFSGAVVDLASQPFFMFDAIPNIITGALQNEGKRILRECENTLREEKNIPKVGEGWISEATLFYILCKAFPNEKIVHHGRPAWLSPQHLDIYFPKRNIGLEYQGLQHQNPVEYFGGEEAFKKQQRRDRKKNALCKKNGCNLLYAYEGYDTDELIHAISNMINGSVLIR